MDKSKFLKELREVLSSEVSAQIVRDNIDYYSQYIDDEIRKGRSEQDVMDELGDPWVIAKTIIDTSASSSQGDYTYDSSEYSYGNNNTTMRSSKTGEENKGFLHILKVILIVAVVFVVLMGIFRILAPIVMFAFPIIMIVFVVRYIKNRMGGGGM